MTASRTANTSTASTDLPDGEDGFYTVLKSQPVTALAVDSCGVVAGAVAVLLWWCCGSFAAVQAVVPFDGPVGVLVGGPVGGPVGCPVIDLVGELVIDLVSGLVGGPVRGLSDGPVCCPVGAVGGTSIMQSTF